MKTIIKLSVLFLAVVLMACQKENSEPSLPNDVITISDGMIQSPKWLVDEVNRVADQYSPSPETGEKFYPSVYSVTYNGQHYIFVWDGLNACWVCGHRYFTLSGNLIDSSSSLQVALEEIMKETDSGLLWRYEYRSPKSKSTATRADRQISFYTPKGRSVPDTWIRDEWYTTSARLLQGRNYFKSVYPNAVEVSRPSTTYNCHGYVWSITEGGSRVWIGYSQPGATNVFVDEGSYVVTSSNTPGAKVRYLNADHSAIAETSDIFVSKWNEFPLYRHNKNYSPFGSSPQLAYYTRSFILAPVISCPLEELSDYGKAYFGIHDYDSRIYWTGPYPASLYLYVSNHEYNDNVTYIWQSPGLAPDYSSPDPSYPIDFEHNQPAPGLYTIQCWAYKNGSHSLPTTVKVYVSDEFLPSVMMRAPSVEEQEQTDDVEQQ